MCSARLGFGGIIMTIEVLKKEVITIVNDYPIKRIALFGSRASGMDYEDSDVDLITEFSLPISLLTLSMIKLKLEDILKVSVDSKPFLYRKYNFYFFSS